jgi:hypothetical protein
MTADGTAHISLARAEDLAGSSLALKVAEDEYRRMHAAIRASQKRLRKSVCEKHQNAHQRRVPAPKLNPSLTVLGDEQGSSSSSARSGRLYGSEPRKPHSRARLRDLDRAWLRAWRSRSALACGRAGNPRGINAHARPGPEKETPVACTFEGCQNAHAGRLTPHIGGGWRAKLEYLYIDLGK